MSQDEENVWGSGDIEAQDQFSNRSHARHLYALLTVTIPLKVESSSNLREHWTAKHRREKNLRQAVKLFLGPQIKPPLPAIVELIRVAPRSLDEDNLAAAMKPAIDAVADWLIPGLAPGRADGHKDIKIKLDQRKAGVKEYALEIKIYRANDG